MINSMSALLVYRLLNVMTSDHFVCSAIQNIYSDGRKSHCAATIKLLYIPNAGLFLQQSTYLLNPNQQQIYFWRKSKGQSLGLQHIAP